MDRYERDVALGNVAPPIVERTTPMADVGAFLQLALGSGFVVFVAVGLLALAAGVTVKLALALAGLVILAVGVVFMRQVWRSWFQTETVRSARPEVRQLRDRVEVEVSQPEQRRMQFLDFAGNADQLRVLARGVLSGRSFSEGEWTGSGGLYSRSEFRDLRGQMLERGLLSWRNDNAPAQGVELTAPGRAVFRRLAEGPRAHAHVSRGGPVTALLYQGKGRGGGHG